jgi:histidinol-phosphate aminotransferase
MNKKFDIDSLCREDIKDYHYWGFMSPFLETEEGKEGFLKLDMGESAFPPPSDIWENVPRNDLHYYPGVSKTFMDLVAQENNTQEENIFPGNGSLDVLENIFRLCIDPQDEVVIFPPTYPLYFHFVKLARAKLICIPRSIDKNEDDGYIDLEMLEKKITPKTKLIVIDNPNNPFGFVVPQKTLKKILGYGIMTVVDEAYFEYCGETAASLIEEYPNVIITRTFSKVIGLAGMRLGYSISYPKIRENLIKVCTPHQVNILAQKLAISVLKKGIINKRIKLLTEGRKYLLTKMRELPFLRVYNSEGAYILFRSQGTKYSSRNIYDHFYTNKILLKEIDFPEFGEGYLRMNVVPKVLGENIVHTFQQL